MFELAADLGVCHQHGTVFTSVHNPGVLGKGELSHKFQKAWKAVHHTLEMYVNL